jgi:eukaryotic-like serine/threonine-protein kinase
MKPRLFALASLVMTIALILTACAPTASTPRLPATAAPATAAPAAATLAPTEMPTSTSTSVPTPAPSPTPAPTLPGGSVSTRSVDGMIMLYVPEGEFTMGMSAGQALGICQTLYDNCIGSWFTDEGPVHTVSLAAYWIDRTEVTNAMYSECEKQGKCTPPHSTTSPTHEDYYTNSFYGNYPVIFVDWNQANAYCKYAGARLLTEAEWEKAARGTNASVYPWGNFAPALNLANFRLRGSNNTDAVPVGGYSAGKSTYGAFDLIGNVAEWVADWYAADYYASSPTTDPQGPASGDARVIRGGGWATTPAFLTAVFRDKLAPYQINDYVGFRCGRSAN